VTTTARRPGRAGVQWWMCTCGHPDQTHGSQDAHCLVLECSCREFTARPRRNKYGAVRVVGPLGELYDSKAERDYAAVLEHRRIEIQDIGRWAWAPRFVLQDNPLITYRPDFLVWPSTFFTGQPFYAVDVKGHTTRDFSLRVRLWKARYPNVPLCVVKNGVEDWQ
jgi:hypothetical protein